MTRPVDVCDSRFSGSPRVIRRLSLCLPGVAGQSGRDSRLELAAPSGAETRLIPLPDISQLAAGRGNPMVRELAEKPDRKPRIQHRQIEYSPQGLGFLESWAEMPRNSPSPCRSRISTGVS